nr:hypothetical protein [Pseudoflavonifractor phocaeensis]
MMTKGHFTSSGHFIVLRGVKNEQILVADPASTTRSQKAWDLSIILNEASKSATRARRPAVPSGLNTPPETVPLDRTNGAPRPLKWCMVTAAMVH